MASNQVASLLLVTSSNARSAPNSVLAPSSDALVTSSDGLRPRETLLTRHNALLLFRFDARNDTQPGIAFPFCTSPLSSSQGLG